MITRGSFLERLIGFFLEQKLVVLLLVLLIGGTGVAFAPFDWQIGWLPRSPVPVDAIPNLGENQQIIFTEWPGRSPQDVEDQVTYPLTVALLGVPGVREVRSQSEFGFSMIFLIFEEHIDFYWSRARILEKLNSLPAGRLPEGVQPALGPDATALGQIFWYTIEGRDPEGRPAGGWDLHELRSVQDWYVRYGLQSAAGISEVASIGGYVQEYQVDVDPDAMRAYGVALGDVVAAVARSNLDVGARVTEINRVEYVIRGVGFIKELADIEHAPVALGDDYVPVRVRDVAVVTLGPAERRGVLTHGGAEAVGGVAVVREGYNPLEAINNVKDRISEISPGLPARAVIDWTRTSRGGVERFAREKGFEAFDPAGSPALNQEKWLRWLQHSGTPREAWPEWVTISRLHIVPFYDRTGLIYETLGTLSDALLQQMLITVIVVIVMVLHLRVALIISATLPLAVLLCFICMKLFGVDSNIVSLAGIAIAIGSIVDMGIIVTENALRHLREAPDGEPRLEVVRRAAAEVGPAILTAISTTVISFLAVFTMTGAEGKMFVPLAFTKTFVLLGSVFVALAVLPAAVHLLVARRFDPRAMLFGLGLAAVGVTILGLRQGWVMVWTAGVALLAIVVLQLLRDRLPPILRKAMERAGGAGAGVVRLAPWAFSAIAVIGIGLVLASVWEPLGPERGLLRNTVFVAVLVGGLLGVFYMFQRLYAPILRLCLGHKALFLVFPAALVLMGACVWMGFDRVFALIPAAARHAGLEPQAVRTSAPWVWAMHAFPGLGREFMPPLDEGSFLWMPTTMPHASVAEALDVLQHQDMAIAAIPEVESVTGKIGRADSPLDPAPLSMIETVIIYAPEYVTDEAGRPLTFAYDRRQGEFLRTAQGELIPDSSVGGRPYRRWREHINGPQDIWEEIVAAAHVPGTTIAPKLQPIETRQIMLQTGMRAAMGIKVRAPDLDTLDRMAVEIERLVRQVPGVNPATVNAERVVGKPYLEINIDRTAIARYGLNIADVQDVITVAIGGLTVTTTVEGRERYPVRVRFLRELRGDIEALRRVLVAGRDGAQIPLGEVADIRYVRGPQMIRSEDTFLTAYVTFGQRPGLAEVDAVEQVGNFLRARVAAGELAVPPGASWRFAGSYEHQLRAARTLRIVVPVSLLIIFLILYFQFRAASTALIVFSGIAVAWAGGFVMLYWYGQDWFANFDVFGVNMRELFQLQAINLSVAVWVGFLALFGIATDDGVVMATYLRQSFARRTTETIAQLREATVAAGLRRVRPCLMTSATTILALLPVLTSAGRGADVMIPMAIPSVGGMSFVLLSMFTVPVLFCLVEEIKLKRAAAGLSRPG